MSGFKHIGLRWPDGGSTVWPCQRCGDEPAGVDSTGTCEPYEATS